MLLLLLMLLLPVSPLFPEVEGGDAVDVVDDDPYPLLLMTFLGDS